VSYQTEERYWTDYVRVATPIIGLLLLLGVFWYWASSLIGADSEEPPATAIAAVTVVAAPTATPTPTEEVELPAETAEPTEAGAEPSPTSEPGPKPTRTPRQQAEEPTEEAEEPTAEVEAGSFAEGEVILSKDDGVNMRAEPSTDAEVLEVLSLDQPLTVVDGQPQEGGGFVWWNVRNEDSGNVGWVVEEWLKKQE
jgi:outer membrane biosynthesis protein TonB